MGSAFGAVADDVFGPYWNPAGIVETTRYAFGTSHTEWIEGVQYEFLCAASPIGRPHTSAVPLLAENFDDGADPNLLGGATGTWSDQDAGGTSIVTNGYRKEKQGHAYRMSYIIQPLPDGKPGWGGVWMSLEGKSAKPYRFLVIRMRGAYGGEQLTIGLKDRQNNEHHLNVDDYGGITSTWRHVSIPLSAFKNVDHANLDNISFSFNGSGAIYIDDVMFTGKRTKKHAMGLSIGHLTSGDIPRTVEIATFPYYQESGSFDASSSVMTFTYGRGMMIGPIYLPMGVNLKYIRENLGEANAAGYAMDFGIHISPADSHKFRFGFTLQNIGTMGAFIKERDPLPTNFKCSFLVRSDSGRALYAFDMDMPTDGQARFRMGWEWWWLKSMAFRAGYSFGEERKGLLGMATGMGIRIGGLVFDYAFTPMATLGNTHRISAAFHWGQPR